jgi:thioesterase domain-containing protein
MAADLRRKESESATRKVLASLGIEDVDKAKAAIEAAKAADEASKTELQKAQDAVAAAVARADEAEAKARGTLVLSKLENQLRDAGINPQRVDGAMKLAPLNDVQIAADGSIVGLEDAVKAVKEASPEWFGAPGKPFSAPEIGGPPPEISFGPGTDPAARAAELAKYSVKPVHRAISY